MNCWDSDMPEDVARAFAVWDGPAAGNVSETARLLAMRRPTVQEWSQRYRWRERQAEQRAEDRDRTIANAWARMVGLLDGAVETVEAGIASRIGQDGKPTPGSPTPVALRAAFGTLERFGVSPQRAVTLTVDHTPSAHVTDAELDALLAAGDTAALLALASGRPLPPPAEAGSATPAPPGTPSLPPDFTSDQPGGRGVLGPTLPVPQDPVFEAEFTATSEPAPMRFYDPNGEGYEDVPQG